MQRKAQMLEIFGRRRFSGVLALLVSAVGLLGMAQAAQAGTLYRSGTVLVYSEGGGVTNAVDLVESVGNAYFRDSGTSYFVDASSGCTNAGTTVAAGTFSQCGAASSVAYWVVSLGDLNDSVSTNYCCSGTTLPLYLFGGPGNDTLNGGTNNDYFDGEAGDDTINGGSGSDTMYGSAGNDTLNPADGDDFVVGGPGDENVVDGGPGTDTFSYSDGRTNGVSVVLNDGTAQNDGGVDDNAASGQREALQNFENITGSNGSDTLTGTAGANNIQGLAGDDLFDGGLGADTLNGGSGNFDRVTYGSRSAAVSVSFDGQANDGQSGEGDLVQNMDGATGGSGGDKLSACLTAAAPCAGVNPGGLTGDVNFDGGAGNDDLTGANGNDFFRGGAGADSVVGNGGPADTMIYDDHSEGVTAVISGGQVSGNSTDGPEGNRDVIWGSVERITGTNGDDVLVGDDNVNQLSGLKGNDRLQGRGANDSLDGGDGDGSNDIVDYSYATSAVSVDLGSGLAGGVGDQDTITGFEGAIGGSAGDTLTGDADLNTLDGGDGNDTIDGKAGQDTLFGGSGNDNIESRDGEVDVIDCGADTDTNNADAGDVRSNCELPAPPAPPASPASPPPPPPAQPQQATPLKVMAVTVSYGYTPKSPKANTTFIGFAARNVPKGSRLVARCVNAKGKKCKGKLGKATTVKKTTKKSVALKAFNKKYPAGSQLEVIVSKAGYKTQVKIVQVRKNKIPNIVTRCQTPPSTRRAAC